MLTIKEFIAREQKQYKRIGIEILDLMKEIPQKMLNKDTKHYYQQVKKEWLNEKCAEYEKLQNTDIAYKIK